MKKINYKKLAKKYRAYKNRVKIIENNGFFEIYYKHGFLKLFKCLMFCEIPKNELDFWLRLSVLDLIQRDIIKKNPKRFLKFRYNVLYGS